MKTTEQVRLCVYMSLLCMNFTCRSQSITNQKYGAEEDYKRLYYLNTQYIQSWIRSDTSTYNRLLWAEDFVHQNSADGLLYTKKKLLPLFGKPRFDKIEYFFPENVTIQFITNDVAMIFARTPFKAAGQSSESFGQYNDVYVRRDGKWICVSANVTSVQKPGDARGNLTTIPQPVPLISHHAGTDADISALKALNEKHLEAFILSRVDVAEGILGDDYTMLAADGLVNPRKSVIEQIKNMSKDQIAAVASYRAENVVVRFVAPDVAMVHALAVVKLKDGWTTGTQYNDIYAKRGDRWLCVSGNNTPVR